MDEVFGDVLRRYRRAAGFTQEELAERSSLSVEAISAIERGWRRAPRRDTLQRLAAALVITGAAEDTFIALGRSGRRAHCG